MPANDPVLLDLLLDQRRSEIAPGMSQSDFFELFVAEEILKDRSLSYSELESGLVGGPNDGGIDGFWVFANGELVQEDTDLGKYGKNVELEIVIVQAKESNGFGEEPINKLIAVTENLLDLSCDLGNFEGRYSSNVLGAVKIFRDTYQGMTARFPTLRFRFVYATKGTEVHYNTKAKAHDLTSKIPALFSSANTEFAFIGAPELIALARRQSRQSFALTLAESPISAGGAVAYVCLVKLKDLFEFITDRKGNLLGDLFEANVRDYQGKTEVNEEIKESLQCRGAEDFWWLNNGITVLSAQATLSGRTLTVADPQIVNGLQTSRQIFEHFSGSPEADDPRLVLVRVIVPAADESRDKIIKATNSQTSIPPASLKATDKIQRDIEEYLKCHNLYYDRRKNFYKIQGKRVGDIVGIPRMAQALMATILASPDTARGRPSSLIKNDSDYARLFSDSHPIEAYLACIRIVRQAEDHLRTLEGVAARDRNNVLFYVVLELARDITGENIPSPGALGGAVDHEFTEPQLTSATDLVLEEYRRLGGTDQVAKGTDLKAAITARRRAD